MEKINALGKPCPIPVIETKKVIKKLDGTGGVIEILVDNEVARQNIEKMATGLGYETTYEQKAKEHIVIRINVTSSSKENKQKATSLVIAFGSNHMGNGAEELGKILLKGYIYSLNELETVPEHLLFFNSGAFLTTKDSTALADLLTLVEKGTKISTCGTCIDYYELQGQTALGEITNMYAISEIMANAGKVVTI